MDGSAPRNKEFHWGWVWLALVFGLAAGVVVTMVLWGDKPQDHRDAFEVGWKCAAAVLAVLAAFVSVDRLRLSQREHQRQLDADRAAREESKARQITDLSSKASEQLGSEKAAVRIGGLTDLERLAQAYPELRQTVVDRICAYLRAPFVPPPERTQATPDIQTPEENHSADVVAARLELDVRRTAQQILNRHVGPLLSSEGQSEDFWGDTSLDLRDAVLIEMDLRWCQVARADFRHARFYGAATFDGANFLGTANFDGTNFDGRATFDGATFAKAAWFREATFSTDASFQRLTFHGNASFEGATFRRDATFDQSTVTGRARFGEVVFDENASFAGVTFTRDAEFRSTAFGGHVFFEEATFTRVANFREATFVQDPQFFEARVAQAHDPHTWLAGWRVEPDSDDLASGGRLVAETA